MPYRRRYSSRKRRVTRKGVVAIARRVVNRNLEEKWFSKVIVGSTTNPGTAVPTLIFNTWTLKSALAGIQQGTTAQARLGDRIRLKRIEFLIKVEPIVNAGIKDGTSCRMIVYHNKQANGTDIPPTAIFDYDKKESLRNITQARRVSVLRDYTHQMVAYATGTGDAVTTAGPAILYTWKVFPKKQITFSANEGTINDLLTDDYGFGITAEGGCCQALIISKVVFTDA